MIGQSALSVLLPRLEQAKRAQEAADMIGAIHAGSSLWGCHRDVFSLKAPDAIMIKLNQPSKMESFRNR